MSTDTDPPVLVTLWRKIEDLNNAMRELTQDAVTAKPELVSTHTWILCGQTRGLLDALRQSIGRDIDDANRVTKGGA